MRNSRLIGPSFRVVLLSFLLLSPAVSGCGGDLPSATYPHEKEYDPRKHEYVIGVSDELRVTVWKMAELSDDVVVRPDGTITLPLIGDIHAANRTPSRVQQEIRQKLGAFVKDEHMAISVEVQQVNSYRFVVSGNVANPGPKASKYYVTVSEALVLAGGPTRFATPERAVILRADGAGKIRRIPINAKAVAEGRHLEQDLAIVSGDTILVP